MRLLGLFFMLATVVCQAQTGKQPLQKLFDNGSFKVELELDIPPNACAANSRQVRYRYKLTGRWSTQLPRFVNWSIEYQDCKDCSFEETFSLNLQDYRAKDVSGGMFFNTPLEWEFSAKSLDINSIKAFPSTSSMANVTNQGCFKKLEAPLGIRGSSLIRYGQSIDIEVAGGSLGTGSKWVWYAGSCGGRVIGEGERLQIIPQETTTIYVRGENNQGTTQCVEHTIEVDSRSIGPQSISGLTQVCKGDSSHLSVVGGKLGRDAEWYWYTDKCGGKRIGKGESITVSPTDQETYFVRAESHFNITECASLVVNASEKVTISGSIQSSKSQICRGEEVNLRMAGTKSAPDLAWVWYEGTCDGRLIGSGKSISVNPTSTTTYFVGVAGSCNPDNCLPVTIEVHSNSTAPFAILKDNSMVYKGDSVTLSVSGGKLSEGAKWVWYSDTVSRELLGTGSTLITPVFKPSPFFVAAQDACGTTEFVSTFIDPLQPPKDPSFYFTRPKTQHIGIGLGAEWQKFEVQGQFRQDTFGVVNTFNQMSSLGLKGELVFHPIFKDHFSLGIQSQFAIGTSTYFISTRDSTQPGSQGDSSYFYTRINLVPELAFGWRTVKLLFKYDGEILNHNFGASGSQGSDNDPLVGRSTRGTLSAGLRLGRYAARKPGRKRGGVVDVYYSISSIKPSKTWMPIPSSEDSFRNSYSGLGATWWLQSAFRLNFQMTMARRNAELRLDDNPLKGAEFHVSFLWNRNWFY